MLFKNIFASALICAATVVVGSSGASPLVFGVPNKIDRISLRGSSNAQTRLTLQLIYENISRINVHQEIEPLLAESWEFSPETKSLMVQLRSNHKFSDGTLVDAQEVKKVFDEICADDHLATTEMLGTTICVENNKKTRGTSNVEVLNRFKLRFHIDIMPSLFLYQLALPRMAIGKRIPEGEFPLGSGPYKILRQSDDLLELVVNPFYHSPSALKNNGVTLKYVDENAFLDGLRKDHLDGTIMYRAQAIPQGLPDSYRLLSDKPNITFALVLNPKRYPFDKPIVRKFVMAELYNTTRWEACATHVRKAYGYIPAGLGGSLSAMAPLKMVGPSKSEVMTQVPQLKKGAKISIQQHQGRKSECEAKAISSALEKINIEAKWNYHSDYKTLWPKYLKNDYDAFAELFVFSQREAFSQLRRFYSTSRENFENIRELSLDELIRSIWAPSSTSRRYEVYRSVNEFLLSYASVIPLYYSSHRNLLNKCIQGVKEDEFVFDPFPNLFRLSRSTSCQGAL